MTSPTLIGRFFEAIRRSVISVSFFFVRIQPFNFIATRIIKPFTPILPRFIPDKFPVAGRITVSYPGSTKLILQSNGRDTIASRLFWNSHQGHEPETVNVYRKLLNRSSVVIDVGASTGLFTLIAGQECPYGEIHAFEPVPETFDFLVRNINLNHFTNVTAVRACATSFDGKIDLYLNESPALHLTASVLAGYRASSGAIHAPSITLDSYASKNSLDKIDLIKIDAEGSDDMVLAGAVNILKHQQPLIICEVLYDHTDKLLQSFLEDTGYQYLSINDKGLQLRQKIIGDKNYKYRNYLLVPKSKLAEITNQINTSAL